MSYFFKYLHSIQNVIILHNQFKIPLFIYSFCFPFPASPFPFIIQPREKLNCCRTLMLRIGFGSPYAGEQLPGFQQD